MEFRKVLAPVAVAAAFTAGCSSGRSATGGRAVVAPAPTTGPGTTAGPAVPAGPSRSTTTRVTPTTTRVTPTTARAATTSTPAAPAPTRPPPVATRVATAPACPPSLASQLAYTGSAGQLITVLASGYGTPDATVQIWQKADGCWVSAGGPWPSLIGESGFSDHHREGDGSTPTGMYGLGPVMYGTAPDPGVREPYHQLVCGDWWDENPSSSEYNTFQHVACGTTPSWVAGSGSEALWQETAPYPSFAVIDYNTGPIVAGAGSAIFLHADTGSATVGCVSVPLAELDQALRWLDPARAPAFVMGPAAEITRF